MSDDAGDVSAEPLNAEDVAFLNREIMRDAAVRARLVAIILMVVGTVGAAGWMWITIRTQQNVRERSFAFRGGGVTALDRLDAAVTTVGVLVTSAFTFGVGVALSLMSSHLTVTYGGTLSGFEEGDVVTGEETSEL